MKSKFTVIFLIVLAVLALFVAFGDSKDFASEPDDLTGFFKNLTQVKVLKPITIEVEGTDSDMTLIVGEKLLLIQSNNKSEVMIETLTGLKSRFNVDMNFCISGTEYGLNDVFEIIR